MPSCLCRVYHPIITKYPNERVQRCIPELRIIHRRNGLDRTLTHPKPPSVSRLGLSSRNRKRILLRYSNGALGRSSPRIYIRITARHFDDDAAPIWRFGPEPRRAPRHIFACLLTELLRRCAGLIDLIERALCIISGIVYGGWLNVHCRRRRRDVRCRRRE